MIDPVTKTPHPVDVEVGRRLRDQSVERSASQTDIAKALGLSFQQVQKYERGVNRVSASTLFAMSQVLDVPVETLFPPLQSSEPAHGPRPRTSTPETAALASLAPGLPKPHQKLLTDVAKALLDRTDDALP